MKNVIQLVVAIVSVFIGSLQATPSITNQPASANVVLGSSFTVQVEATGNNLEYQWWFTNSASTNVFTDGTNSSYTVTNAAYTNSGNYWVVVREGSTSVPSSPAFINVSTIAIFSPPASTNVALGSNFTVKVAAMGDNLAFQWWFTNSTWTNVSTYGTNESYTVTNATYTNGGQYWVVVSNGPNSSVASPQAVINVWAKPTIVTNPVSQILPTNTVATLTVVASGGTNAADAADPLWYEWYKGTNSLGAASTNSSAKTNNWTGPVINSTATYSVVVTNAVGTVTSAVAVVEFVVAPVFTNPPPPSTIYLATSTNYTILSGASGKYVSYQWYDANGRIDSQTNATLVLSNVTSFNNGSYTNTATNYAGAVTNTGTTVTVYDPPTIINQPVGATNFGTSQTSTISVGAVGPGSLQFAWSVGGINLGGGVTISSTNNGYIFATNTFTIPGFPVTNGTYIVTVTNEVGKVTSSGTVVKIVNVPVFITQPVTNMTLTNGGNYTLSVVMADATNQLLSYQWYYTNASTNGVYTNVDRRMLDGATSSTYALTNVNTTNTPGSYFVIVSNAAKTVTSSNAVIGVMIPPSITGVWATNSVPGVGGISNYLSAGVGTNTILIIEVGGSTNLSYQWKKGTNLLDSITSSLNTYSNIVLGSVSNSGTYTLTVSNLVGGASTNVTVTFVEAPVIPASQPADAGALVNGSATLSVVCTNTSMLSYQWYKAESTTTNKLDGFTNSSYTLSNIQSNSSGYFVIVNNPANIAATSRLASVFVQTMPVINHDPTNTVVAVGSNLVTYVDATGGVLNYQWRNGTNLVVGTTNANGLLVITNAQTTNSGNYSVIISNVVGKVTSTVPAVVWVVASPVIVTNPSTAVVTNGVDHTFVVGVANAANSQLSYQWYWTNKSSSSGFLLPANALSGETNAYYTVKNVTPLTHSYMVVVSNVAGMATSTVAHFTVQIPPKITSQPLGTNIGVGTNAILTVTATGSSLTYYWYTNSQMVAGSNDNTFTITGGQTNNSGVYSVVVSNLLGSVSSSDARVWVVDKPQVATSPSDATALVGGSKTFTVVCTNADTSALNYQWWYSNTTTTVTKKLDEATSSSYSISSIGTNDGGGYFVIVTNVAGSDTSSVAILTVLTLPTISQQPTNPVVVGVGTNLTNNVIATGGLLGYQWWRDVTNLVVGATNDILAITNAQTTNSGYYTVIITNAVGAVTSDPPAEVWVVKPPKITNIFSQVGASLGGECTFVATVSNAVNSVLSYQWYFNATSSNNIIADANLEPGQVFDSYWLPGVDYYDEGWYAVVVTNVAGADTSIVARLSIMEPPTITTELVGTNIGLGSTGILTVAASGTGTGCLWYKGTNVVGGSNDFTFTINNAKYTNSGKYTVVVTNLTGSATSGPVDLYVMDYPWIVTQPKSVEVEQGENATLTVVATNMYSNLLTYQWYQVISNTDVLVDGETSSNLVVYGVTTNSYGVYRVSITSAPGFTTNSSNATITMLGAPVIKQDPTNTDVVLGSKLTMTVAASGGGSPSYQWWRTNSSGRVNLNNNAATYTIASTPLTAAGYYQVVVSNYLGKATSSPALVQVVSKPGIAKQPVGITNQVGTEYTFTVTATPTNLVSGVYYQWYTNGTSNNISIGGKISSATSSNYYISSLSTNHTAWYTVVITNIAGAVTSTPAHLVAQSLPLITTQPIGAIVPVEGSVKTLMVLASGDGLGYQWYKSNQLGYVLTSSNLPTYDISPYVSNTASYYVVVTNLVGRATSAPAKVIVVDKPVITNQPASYTNVIGNNYTFTVGVTNTALTTIHYQWMKGTNIITNATDANYTILGTTLDDAATNYNVVVTNIAGATTSKPYAKLSVDAPPAITSQYYSNKISIYTNATLTVVAGNNNDLVYRWLKDDKIVQDSNGTSFLVSGAVSNTATYSVSISNLAGSVTSKVARVTVVTNLVIASQPTNVTQAEWTNVEFHVTLENSDYADPHYQWRKNGSDMGGQTNSNLVLNLISLADEGDYTVVITNITGSKTSDIATLVVEALPVITVPPSQYSTNLATNGTLTLDVTAIGRNLYYQWWKGYPSNVVQSFSQTSSYSTTATNAESNSGWYWVTVTNSAGVVTSDSSKAAEVNVVELPIFASDLTNFDAITYKGVTNVLAKESGGAFVIGVTVTNVPDSFLSYQWYRTNMVSTNALDSEVFDTYALGSLTSNDNGGYFVVVTNLAGSVTSAVAQLLVLRAPTVGFIPNREVTNGQGFAILAPATGDDISTNWFKGTFNNSPTWITNGIFTNQDVTVVSNGSYYVEVTNAVGKAHTNFDITIIGQPSVGLVGPTTNSTNYIKADGVDFCTLYTTNLTGGGVTNYQWFTNINGSGFGQDTGSNGPNYTVSVSATGFTNAYYVVVTNVAGTNYSTNWVIAELPITNIVSSFTGPTNVAKTSNLVLSVTVTNADVLMCQWYKNGTPIQGSNTTNLTFSSAVIFDSGSYYVTVTNHVSGTNNTNANMVVKVVGPPAFLNQPTNNWLVANTNSTSTTFTAFSVQCVSATNSLLSYEWFWTTNNVTSSNAMTPAGTNAWFTLTLTNAGSRLGTNLTGKYWVVVSNVAGTITSTTNSLDVQTIPIITGGMPTNAVIAVGKSWTNPVTVSGEGTLVYTWSTNSHTISSLTTNNLIIQNAQVTDSGTYRLIVNNLVGAATNTANVSVVTTPLIITQPQSQTLLTAHPVTFRVIVNGADSNFVSYFWWCNTNGGSDLQLAGNTNTYTIANVAATNSGTYWVVVSNVANSVPSSIATLWAESWPTSSTPVLTVGSLANGAIATNQPFTLTVTNSGDNVGVQYWLKDGAIMQSSMYPEFTNYVVTSAAISNSGSYQVSVTNHVGANTSAPCVVNVVGVPVISAQPVGVSLTNGAGYTLSVGVGSPANALLFTNQWYHSGNLIAGATNSFYRMGTNSSYIASTNDAGDYYVSVTDAAGTTTSSNATIIVMAKPEITTEPTGITNAVGYAKLNTNLTAKATGGGTNGGNLTFLWYLLGANSTNPLSGDSHEDKCDASGFYTSTVTNITSAQSSNSGDYLVVVTNSVGSYTSLVARVMIEAAPTIEVQPKGSTNIERATYTFSVVVSNAADSVLSYQWVMTNFVNHTLYTNPAWNTDRLPLINLNATNAGGYYVIVSNTAGSTNSEVATLSIQSKPVITTNLYPTNFAVSSNLTLTVGATAVGGKYTWFNNGTNVLTVRTNNIAIDSTDSSSVLTITNAQTSDSGVYSVLITNISGFTNSANATVWVVDKPVFMVQPADGIGTERGNYTFSVVVSNALKSALSYQWWATNTFYPEGTNILGATNSYLTVTNLTSTNTGKYFVVVANVADKTNSRVATLTVRGFPKWGSQPASTNLVAGSNLVLSATVYGSAIDFTWRQGTNKLGNTNIASITNLNGSITSTLTLSNAPITWSTNYSVSVTNSLGGMTSTNAAVLVVAAPEFQTDMATNVYVADGSNYTFSVTMTNAAKSLLSYQWSYTNVVSSVWKDIDGATTNRYVWGGEVGGYRVIVTNIAGKKTSEVSVLAVTVGRPGISVQPLVSQPYTTNLATNGTITMRVVATNGGNFTYQWKKGAVIVPSIYGGNADTLTITNARLTNAGVYSVSVANAVGAISSISATVNVLTRPAFQINPVGATNVSGATNTYAFSVTMSNAANSFLSYQWYTNSGKLMDGTNTFADGTNVFTGATNRVFTIIGLSTNNSDNYSVIVTNLAGSATSSVAKLLVLDRVAITNYMTNNSLMVVTLTDVRTNGLVVGASGSDLRYQWYKNGTFINHATNAVLTNTTPPSANMGVTTYGSNNYYVIVSNRFINVKSSNVIFMVVAPPSIQTEPIGANIKTNSAYKLTVVASNAALSMLSYQWYTNNNTNFSGANSPAAPYTNSAYSLTNVTLLNDAYYSVIVSNIAGSITSSWVKINVKVIPVITNNVATYIYVTNGASVVLGTNVGVGADYQWFKNGTAMKGSNVINLTFTSAVVTNSGVYYVVASNIVGSVTSSNIVLTVVTNPVFVTSLSNKYVALGSNCTFSVVMTNATNALIGYRYQWFKPGNIVWEGAFTNTASLANVGYGDQGTYQVVVTNVCGLANTSSATLTVQAMPVITNQPTPETQTITNGMDFTVTVGATGDGLFYQWSKKRGTTTTIVKDATNSSLTISAATSTNSGAYSVVISNMVGKVTSSNAQVNIWQLNGSTWIKYTVSDVSATNASLADAASVAGDYAGLFVAANGVPTHQTAGLLVVSVTSSRAYSGKLFLGGEVIGISGQLDESGNSVAEFERPGKSAITVTLTANVGSKQLTGSVRATGWTSVLIADCSVFSIANPAPSAGDYGLVIPATQPADGLSGTGRALVSADGAITFVGTTSEGISISQSTTVSKDGYWPFYAPDADGEIIGWLQFINGEPVGTLNWINSSGTDTTVSEVIGSGSLK